MLKDLIPAPYRKTAYTLYAVAAVIVGALSVGGVNVGTAPDVLAYLGIAIGAVAASNVSTHDDLDDEDGAVSLHTLAVVCIAIVTVLWFFGFHGRIG